MQGIRRTFDDGERRIRVLDGLDLEVAAGERVAVMGASGSGKSTLLHLAGGMDLPDEGSVELLGRAIHALEEPERTTYRAAHIGLIFQEHNLVDALDARENLRLVPWLTRTEVDEERIESLARALGVEDLLDRRPSRMSGGQRQRVAIARALVHAPRLVLADEPTGSLDQDTADRVMDLLAERAHDAGAALLLATHSRRAAERCDRRLALRGGLLEPLD